MRILIPCVMLLALSACDNSAKEQERHAARQERQQLRMENWAQIVKEKRISPTETIKLLSIPSEFGAMMDTKCLIYSNSEYRQSQMVCGEMDKIDMHEMKK